MVLIRSHAVIAPVPVTRTALENQARALGFHKVGVAPADAAELSQAVQHLRHWLAQQYHADMHWMENPKRFDVHRCLPEVRSVICVALNYYTPQSHPKGEDAAKISRYAWGRDYHKIMDKKLKALASWLQEQGGGARARYYCDTGPVQDKVWAQQAGLGWIAKNGNLITREYGSWVFLGEVLTDLALSADRPHTEHCGSCTRCLEACPTDAITQPFVVDANRCIAYHTIENRSEVLPQWIEPHLEGWVAGCDICQDVCPWNQSFAQATDVADFYPRPENVALKLSELAQISDREWDRRFRGSALRRVKPRMLRRNALANQRGQQARQHADPEQPNGA